MPAETGKFWRRSNQPTTAAKACLPLLDHRARARAAHRAISRARSGEQPRSISRSRTWVSISARWAISAASGSSKPKRHA
jgi:hypothetical protein